MHPLRVISVLLALSIGAALAKAAEDQSSGKTTTTAPAPAPGSESNKPPGPGGPPAMGPPPALVRVGTVQKQQIQDQWDVVGRLTEVRRAIVAAEQSGRVVAMEAEEGQAIVAGKTVLARIDDVWAQIASRAAKAQLQQMKAKVQEETANFDQRQRDLKALEALLAGNSAKPKEVEDARSRADAAKAVRDSALAEVDRTQAELSRAEENLKRLNVLAPFDGVVVRKMTEVGQWLTAGGAVAEIISSGQIDAVIDVPERFIEQVQPGMEIEVAVESVKLSVTGKVVAIIPVASTAARTFPVKVRLADSEGKLKAGMSVMAHVPSGQMSEQFTVPRDAVQRTTTGTVVWANLDGKAMPVGVKILFGVGDRYAVAPTAAPLAPGMQVVIEGAEALFPTRPLIVQNAGP